MEGVAEFLGLMTITALSVSLALLLEWLLLRGVFHALATFRAGGAQPRASPRPEMPTRAKK